MDKKLAAGSKMPEISVPRVGGGSVDIGGDGKWQLAIVYRGQHCPLCMKYLTRLNELVAEGAIGDVDIAVVSADDEGQAKGVVDKLELTFPVGHSLTVDQMREMGLYISHPRSEQETDHDFPEPGLFVVNDQGTIQIIDISNAPFARPDLDGILRGIMFGREKGYPIRGTA